MYLIISDLVHYTSTGEGTILTIDKDSGSMLWTLDLSSPLVSMFLLNDGGGLESVPLTMLAPQTLQQFTHEFIGLPLKDSDSKDVVKKLRYATSWFVHKLLNVQYPGANRKILVYAEVTN